MDAYVIGTMLGGFVSLCVWQGCQIVVGVPVQDRSFLDQPPLGFRLVWPLVRVLGHYLSRALPGRQLHVSATRLRRAGMDYSLSAEQFIAGKWIGSIGFAVLGLLFGVLLNTGPGVLLGLGACLGYVLPEIWLAEVTARRRRVLIRTLPFYLDVITLAVEAGSNLTGGLSQAVMKSGDSPLRSEFNRVLRDIRAGKSRVDALRDLSERAGSASVQNLVASLIQAEKTGSSLGPVLRAQADQLRSERFLLAEKRAMEAPVKLLAPLVLFIFPTTFLVLGFLVLSKSILEGVVDWPPLLWAFHWPAA